MLKIQTELTGPGLICLAIIHLCANGLVSGLVIEIAVRVLNGDIGEGVILSVNQHTVLELLLEVTLQSHLPHNVAHWIQNARPLLVGSDCQPVGGLVCPFNLHGVVAGRVHKLLVVQLIGIVVKTERNRCSVLVVGRF